MRRGSLVQLIVLGVVFGAAATLVALLIPWLPPVASKERDGIDLVYWFTTAICIAIFALVSAVVVYSVWKFRVRPDDDSDGPPIHGHTGIEIVWTAVPAILVTAISVMSGIVLVQNDRTGSNPLNVDVTARQFQWTFSYPDQKNLTSAQLRLPVGRSVELHLTANDVIHSFWVPNFGQKQDAVPGITTRLVITPNRLGTYPIICTELCGLGHAAMRSSAHVVSPSQFASWVKRQRPTGGGGSGGDAGALLFDTQGCTGCHEFTPAGSDAQIGPSLDNLAADAKKSGKPLEDYVHESIRDPGAYVVPGYQNGVMPTFDSLSDEQVDALVQYLTEAKGGAKQ